MKKIQPSEREQYYGERKNDLLRDINQAVVNGLNKFLQLSRDIDAEVGSLQKRLQQVLLKEKNKDKTVETAEEKK